MASDQALLEVAIGQAFLSLPVPQAYCVGAVLVDEHANILSTGFSRELPGNTHAEEVCLLKLSSLQAAVNSTVYSTMEPCGERLSGKIPCAQLLRDAKVKRVVIGAKEPKNFIADCVGASLLRDAGIIVDFLE
ncbi:DRAP deaminase, partial [Nowakowskiella sp. JEL0078]